jgi:hypothetical protein
MKTYLDICLHIYGWVDAGGSPPDWPNANTLLIAAAPDLLHAVRYALNGIDSDGTDWQDVKRVLLAAELKATAKIGASYEI